jgi:hypothetical protein
MFSAKVEEMRRHATTIAVALPVLLVGLSAQTADKDARPSISLRATPSFAFAPARVVMRAELRGGADDYEDFYCPGVEWEWDDGTTSEAVQDCEPYREGESRMKRRYVGEHTFQQAGRYRVVFKLKRNDKVVAAANTTVEIRPGVREPY